MKIKRYLVAGAAAATLAGGAFAFAANLAVPSDTLASGSDTVDEGCSSITVSYDSEYNGENAYELSKIEIVGEPGCETESYKVTIADADGASLEEFEGNLVDGDATITTAVVTAAIDANTVGNVTAVVTGESEDV